MKEGLKDHANKYRAVESTDKMSVISSAEVAKWDSAKLLNFYQFVMLFWEEGKFRCNSGTMHNVYYAYETYPEWPYKEYLHRINVWFSPEDGYKWASFNSRFITLTRVVNTYVKKHPSLVTPEITDLLKDIPAYSWVLESYKTVTTKIGATVVERDTMFHDERNNHIPDNDLVGSPEKNLVEAMLKVTDIYRTVANSIKKEDLEKMTVAQKLSTLQRLSFIIKEVKGFKPNPAVFQQINIYKDGREELEKAILDFGAE